MPRQSWLFARALLQIHYLLTSPQPDTLALTSAPDSHPVALTGHLQLYDISFPVPFELSWGSLNLRSNYPPPPISTHTHTHVSTHKITKITALPPPHTHTRFTVLILVIEYQNNQNHCSTPPPPHTHTYTRFPLPIEYQNNIIRITFTAIPPHRSQIHCSLGLSRWVSGIADWICHRQGCRHAL